MTPDTAALLERLDDEWKRINSAEYMATITNGKMADDYRAHESARFNAYPVLAAEIRRLQAALEGAKYRPECLRKFIYVVVLQCAKGGVLEPSGA